MSTLPAAFAQIQLSADLANQMIGNIAEVSDSFGEGFNRISFGGRDFHLHVGGAETIYHKKQMEVSLVGSAANDHRIFYKESYDPKAEGVKPTCWSSDGVSPDADVEQKQAAKCAECPMNEKGSGGMGGRACSRKRRVVLILEEDSEKKLFSTDLSGSSIYADRENKLGLFNWKDTVKQINTMVRAHQGLIPANFLLQMSFTNDTVPIVQFSFKDQVNGGDSIRPASQATVNAAVEAWSSGEVQRLLELQVSSNDDAEPVQQALQPEPEQPAQQLQPQLQPQAQPQPEPQPAPQPVQQPVQQQPMSDSPEDDDLLAL